MFGVFRSYSTDEGTWVTFLGYHADKDVADLFVARCDEILHPIYHAKKPDYNAVTEALKKLDPAGAELDFNGIGYYVKPLTEIPNILEML